MILDFTKWTKLQTVCKFSLEFFKKYNLFGGHLETFEKIADCTIHELSQVRKAEDWDKFLEDIPEEHRLPLNLVLNLANGYRTINWPHDKFKETRDKFNEIMEKGEDDVMSFVYKADLFGFSFSTITDIHFNSETEYGNIVFLTEKGNYHETWGIVVDDRHYIPISVGF